MKVVRWIAAAALTLISLMDVGSALGGGGEAIHSRHLDVKQGHVGARSGRGLGHLVAAADLGDYLDIFLEGEQGGESFPDHHLVLGQQHPDHAGTVATRRKPWLALSDSEPPTADSRSDILRRPLPVWPAWVA